MHLTMQITDCQKLCRYALQLLAVGDLRRYVLHKETQQLFTEVTI